MKKVISILIIILFINTLKAQELISINPDNTVQESVIELTITGQGTHFSQGSNTSIWFSQGTGTTIYPTEIVVNGDDNIGAQFSFSISDPTGPYDVNATNSIDGDLTLENAFNLYPASTDTFIVSIYPMEAYQQEYLGFSISGNNTNFSQGSNIIWFNQGSNTINSSNYYVSNDEYLYTEFYFSSSSPIGVYSLNIQNETDGALLLENALTLYEVENPGLVSISPNEVNKGDIIEFTIIGENTNFSQASNTITFRQGSNTIIYPSQTSVINDTELLSEVSFYNSYDVGYYELYLSNHIDGGLYLYDAVLLKENLNPPTLISVSPEKSPRNETITLKINGENTNFTQATNLVYLKSDYSIINPNSFIVTKDTEIQAELDLSINDSVGNYSVYITNDFDGELSLENCFILDYGTFTEALNMENLTVFPNPSFGEIKIDNLPKQKMRIDIINVEGKIINTYYNEYNNIVISTNALTGFYIIRISDNENIVTRKILIK